MLPVVVRRLFDPRATAPGLLVGEELLLPAGLPLLLLPLPRIDVPSRPNDAVPVSTSTPD